MTPLLILIGSISLLILTFWVNAKSQNKSKRAVSAVLAALIPTCCGSLLIGWVPPEISATEYWIVNSVIQIATCVSLALLHIKQMKQDGDSYRNYFIDHFNEVKQNSNESDFSIEGQSSFTVLLWGIYGMAALIGSVFLYFAIAQFWKMSDEIETFIFRNNEGFIAALTLLIIVVSGAAVPIYTALAQQVQAQIDSFELQVSDLHRVVVNVSDHANPLWSHFWAVSQAALSNWSVTREEAERAAHDVLFKPFFQLPENKSLHQVTDDELRRGNVVEAHMTYGATVFPENILRGFRDSYLTTPNLASSRERILKNQLFGLSNLNDEDRNQAGRERGDELPFLDRLQRARRLRYLGWMAQGALASAVAGGGARLSRLRPTASRREGIALARYRHRQEIVPEIPIIQQFLVPPTEDFMVAVLIRSLVFGPNREDKGNSKRDQAGKDDDHRNESQKLAAEYRDRAERHMEKWKTTLSSTLVAACNALDIDLGPLVDDVILLEHLAVVKPEYEEGSLARFFYYGHWLNAIADPDSRISQLLSVVATTGATAQADHQHVSDANEVRRRLTSLTRQVGMFCDSAERNKDPIFDGVLHQMPMYWMLDVLAKYLYFSNSWLADVQSMDRDDLNVKQRRFLIWIVDVLGTPRENADVARLSDEELRLLALNLVNPHIRPPRTTESEFAARLHEILDKIYVYCTNSDNDRELMDRFFGRDGQESREEVKRAELREWRARLEARSRTLSEVEGNISNLTYEFIVLMLADHKSALFNWMRAARAVEIRERVTKFQVALYRLPKHQQVRRQLGIEIVPSRHDRLRHLRDYLGLVGYSKPLQVRSIYDLQPTPVERAIQEKFLEKELTSRRHRERSQTMNPYNLLRRSLDISASWKDAVAIDEDTQHWVYQRYFEAADSPMPDRPRTETLVRFLEWIVRVLDPAQDPDTLATFNTEDLVLLALRRVNPRLQRRYEQEQQPENQLPELTEEQYENQLAEINQNVQNYCRNPENARDLQVTFFNLDNPAQERQAPLNYEEWYNRLFQQ